MSKSKIPVAKFNVGEEVGIKFVSKSYTIQLTVRKREYDSKLKVWWYWMIGEGCGRNESHLVKKYKPSTQSFSEIMSSLKLGTFKGSLSD